jgi:hypothetical protein
MSRRRKKNFSCLKEQLKPFFSPKNNHFPKKNELFFLQEHGCSSMQLKPLFPWEHDSFQRNCSWATNLKKLSNEKLFMNEKNNSRKGLN